MEIKIAEAFRECIKSDLKNIVLISGRAGGKTKTSAIIASLLLLEQNGVDGLVARATYGSLAQSSFSEFETILTSDLPDIGKLFKFKKNPLKITNVLNGNTIYFIGFGGSDFNRTKGFHSLNPITFAIFEETQELKDRRSLDEAMASFRRNFGENVKIFILGNPPPTKAHWFNLFIEECKKDTKYLVKKTSYLDILPFINDVDLREILKIKLLRPEYYDWLYMGNPTGGFGSVYPMWNPETNLINNNQLMAITNILRPIALIVGGDGAVNQDATSFVPLLLLENGQCIVLNIFYHDPKINQVIGSHVLVKDYVKRWFDLLIKHYGFGTLEERANDPYGVHQLLPIYFRIDSAATDLIKECQYYLGDRCDVAPIKKSSIVEMVSSVQSALSNDFVYILDEGGYFNYFKNAFTPTKNVLSNQLELLIWNEEQTKYDDKIPNDVSDAFTYAVRFWYSNIENKVFFENALRRREHVRDIKNILNS